MSESKKEFLTFKLANEEFAVEIDRVQEIRSWKTPEPLPNVPSFVKGVIDLRGVIVSVLDLRDRFNIPVSYKATTVVIVVNILTASGERTVGLVVDSVSDVHEFDLDSLQAAPDISSTLDGQYVLGLATIYPAGETTSTGEKKGKMVILVDIDSMVSEGLIDQLAEETGDMPVGNG